MCIIHCIADVSPEHKRNVSQPAMKTSPKPGKKLLLFTEQKGHDVKDFKPS